MIEYDVETTGFQAWSGEHYPFMFQFKATGEDPVYFLWSPEDQSNRAAIQAWFDRAAKEGIRAWNSKFDWAFGDSQGFAMPPEDMWFDGMVDAHAIDGSRSVALKAVSDVLFGDDSSSLQKQVKQWLTEERARRKKAAKENGTELIEPNYSDVPLELMIPYGLEDVNLTERVGEQYDPLIAQSPDLKSIVDFERKVLGALYQVEKRGLPASREGYKHLEVEVIENLERLEDRCIDLAREGLGEDADFNPGSTPQILKALKARNADMSFMEKKDGEIKSADKENLEAVDDELAAAVLAFRSEKMILSTFVRPMVYKTYDTSTRSWKLPFIAPDGRIHTTYRQVGARTGRMSSADPNVQNQPRDDLRLRYNIEAPPGFKLVTCDLSNIEMRLFAAYAGKGALLSAFKENTDLHTTTARAVGLEDRKRAGGGYESARQQGKVFNFTIVYGGGERSIMRYFRVNRARARQMRQRYYDTYPEVARLQARIEGKLYEQGFIKSLWGRKFKMDPRDAYKAVNYLVQGTAADLLKQALINLHAQGIYVVGLVHDEVLALVPENEAVGTRDIIIDALTAEAREGGRLWDPVKGEAIVPLVAEGDIVDRWSDAKPLKDDQGKEYLFTPQWAGGEKRYLSYLDEDDNNPTTAKVLEVAS